MCRLTAFTPKTKREISQFAGKSFNWGQAAIVGSAILLITSAFTLVWAHFCGSGTFAHNIKHIAPQAGLIDGVGALAGAIIAGKMR